jgi:NTP pyrophosphatase (non-canonical NTP hydrolase)
MTQFEKQKLVIEDTAIKILEKWGNEKQIDMIVEECAEVIHAMQKYKRYNNRESLPEQKQKARDNCNEEIADLIIMMHQAYIIFEGDEIDRIIQEKLQRIQPKLKI